VALPRPQLTHPSPQNLQDAKKAADVASREAAGAKAQAQAADRAANKAATKAASLGDDFAELRANQEVPPPHCCLPGCSPHHHLTSVPPLYALTLLPS
jgi:hypothetical protein